MASPHSPEDYYSILQVPPSASAEKIRDAYKRLALRCHPDKNKNLTATSDFQKLARAWEVLRDEKGRREYDRVYGKRKCCDGEEEEEVRNWRERREEVGREAREKRTRHQYQYAKTNAETGNSGADAEEQERQDAADEEEMKRKARMWKVNAKEDYLVRLRKWMEDCDRHIAMIQQCLNEVRCHKRQMQRASLDISAAEEARVSGLESSETLADMERLQISRKLFADCRSRLGILLINLENDRRRFETEDLGARRQQIREALEIIGPRELNPPLFSIIDRRGEGINHWKALFRVKLSVRFPSSLEAYTEGPWHANGEWERVVGEYICGRCSQNVFHIVSDCCPAKCPGCGLIVCNDCYRDLEILREYENWLLSGHDEMEDSLFSLVFDVRGKCSRPAYEDDPQATSTTGFGSSHM